MLLHHSYKKFWIYALSLFLVWIFFGFNNTQSYYFWLKSANNTPENIQTIENTLNVKLPVVSFIFDPRDENDVLNSIDRIVEKLWTDRIYHFTISPDNFSAEDVVSWKFDTQYTAFFKKIKEKNLHIIFRTMHEMNWGRYPWSSNPEKFKAARMHVRTLSRLAWLSEENIAFDFSVNHWDMPTKWIPSQSASLIQCNLWKKDCYHFEDYYPWDEFVDIIWFTFYNWWKAIDNRQRLSPTQILYDKNWKTYERLQKFWKPIIIDEVATTSVRYSWSYDFDKSRKEYLNDDERKDYWLHQLWEFLINHPEIIAAIYFNTDYTHGLSFKVIWEADRAIINIEDNKVYGWFRDLQLFSEKDLDNILKNIFHAQRMTIDWHEVYVSDSFSKEIQQISDIINSKAKTAQDKLTIIQTLQSKSFKSDPINKSLSTLNDLYTQILNN